MVFIFQHSHPLLPRIHNYVRGKLLGGWNWVVLKKSIQRLFMGSSFPPLPHSNFQNLFLRFEILVLCLCGTWREADNWFLGHLLKLVCLSLPFGMERFCFPPSDKKTDSEFRKQCCEWLRSISVSIAKNESRPPILSALIVREQITHNLSQPGLFGVIEYFKNCFYTYLIKFQNNVYFGNFR